MPNKSDFINLFSFFPSKDISILFNSESIINDSFSLVINLLLSISYSMLFSTLFKLESRIRL